MTPAAIAQKVAVKADDLTPDQLSSPDGRYRVAILHKALPHTNPDTEFFTLTVSRDGHVLARFPTQGYLLNAFWSADGRYVAVNNRRANSGDYLWVFALDDGRALRVPDDSGAARGRILSQVAAKFSEYAPGRMLHSLTKAKGWNDEFKLEVVTTVTYRIEEETYALIQAFYQIEGKKLRLVSQTIEKTPLPPSPLTQSKDG